MAGWVAWVVIELALLTLLLGLALWAVNESQRLRVLWMSERGRRALGSRACTCGAYRRC